MRANKCTTTAGEPGSSVRGEPWMVVVLSPAGFVEHYTRVTARDTCESCESGTGSRYCTGTGTVNIR